MSNSAAVDIQLPSIRVDVVEPGTISRRNWIKCVIDENLKFKTAGLQSYCLAAWKPLVYDAFLVAAAVQFCDQAKKRPATGWGRGIELRVPVHSPAHWNSKDVLKTLHEALTFLTGDQWNISFTSRKAPFSLPPQGDFILPDDSRVMIPFSDGLDSWSVAGLMERKYGSRLLRVRLGTKPIKRRIVGMSRSPFTSIPFKVHPGKYRFDETSARSRGFNFALLSGAAAYLSEAEKIIVPESGQGALGPTLVPVGHAYEDYRNHPLFTAKMEAFLLALFDHRVRYIFPRLWYTKGETLAEHVAKNSASPNWMEMRSCWQSRRQVSVAGKFRQCGICAACMLRRMSLHAIGAKEDTKTYVWEDLTAAHFEEGAATEFRNRKPKGALFEYAIAGTLHLDHMADLRHTPQGGITLNRTAFQLSQILGESQIEIEAKLDRLLRQHEEEWGNFIYSLGSKSFVAGWAVRAQQHVD